MPHASFFTPTYPEGAPYTPHCIQEASLLVPAVKVEGRIPHLSTRASMLIDSPRPLDGRELRKSWIKVETQLNEFQIGVFVKLSGWIEFFAFVSLFMNLETMPGIVVC